MLGWFDFGPHLLLFEVSVSLFLLLFLNLPFIYLGCAGSLPLHRLFSSCGSGGCTIAVALGLLVAVAPLFAEQGP